MPVGFQGTMYRGTFKGDGKHYDEEHRRIFGKKKLNVMEDHQDDEDEDSNKEKDD